MCARLTTMRTTLTLDDDVAALLGARQAENMEMSFKELVNGLLRIALTRHERTREATAVKYKVPVIHGAKLLIPPDVKSTHEMLELAEGDWYK